MYCRIYLYIFFSSDVCNSSISATTVPCCCVMASQLKVLLLLTLFDRWRLVLHRILQRRTGCCCLAFHVRFYRHVLSQLLGLPISRWRKHSLQQQILSEVSPRICRTLQAPPTHPTAYSNCPRGQGPRLWQHRLLASDVQERRAPRGEWSVWLRHCCNRIPQSADLSRNWRHEPVQRRAIPLDTLQKQQEVLRENCCCHR